MTTTPRPDSPAPPESPAPPDRTLPPDRTRPPLRLVDEGRFAFGTFDSPVPEVNLLDYWTGLSRRWHATRLKEWQAFQLVDDGWFVLGAVYDAKVLGLVQIVAVRTDSGRVLRWEHKVPSHRLAVAAGLDGTESVGRAKGLAVRFTNELGNGTLGLSASQQPGRGVDAMSLDVVGSCRRGTVGHLVICHAFADGSPLYSNKVMMPAAGSLRIAGEEVVLAADRAVVILDDHKGHYPSPMRYDWVTGAGRDPAGRLVGFNLTDNQVRNPDVYNENAVWTGATVERLGAVHFQRRRGVHGPWRITDRFGQVDVTFDPTVPNEQHVGPRSALADYYGPFGWFSGSIETDTTRLDVDGIFGMGEQKFIRF